MTNYSVVIPSKNNEKVFDAIKSVFDQNEKSVEIIVVDGSSGRIKESLEQFCRDKTRTKYFHESNLSKKVTNRASARNFGAEKAKGDYILFLDADCQLTDKFFTHLKDYFEHHDIVECNVEFTPEDGERCLMDRIVENSGRNYEFLTAGLAVKKSVLEKVKFHEDYDKLREDTDFGLRALENNFSYTYGEKAKVKHYAGSFTIKSFLTERRRFEDEPLFRKRLKDNKYFEKNYSASRIAYPKELSLFTAFVFSLALPGVLSWSAAVLYLVPGIFYIIRSRRQGAKMCSTDVLKILVLALPALVVKRVSMWKGSVKHGNLVV